MGRFFSNMGRGLKLALKTVTFHWKQYFCFYIAILAMEIMFGIVVMSSSKNIDQYESSISTQYDYHFALTNIPQAEREYFVNENDKMSYTPFIVTDPNPSEEGLGFIEVYINQEYLGEDSEKAVMNKSLTDHYADFYDRFINKMPSNNIKPKEVNVEFSPLYNLDKKISEMRLECAGKLLILALVSIAVIILLLNIRLNHFKFTYGIYMSFGADTKKLFSTNFWDMIVIGLLMFIPAALISIASSFTIFSGGAFASGEIVRFLTDYSWLTAFALLFIIPVCIIAVFLPTKVTASQPPLKLLIAQDNSNLVSSPRISSQLFGKKFPKSYEALGLFRFRRYIATVVASSVLFASIFVWISFYANIYNFNIQQEQAEFTITVNNTMKEDSEYVQSDKKKDVTEEYRKLREWVYIDNFINETKKMEAFEKFYDASKYRIEYTKNRKVDHVIDISTGEHVDILYWNARRAIVREGYWENDSSILSQTFLKFEEFITDGNNPDGTNNPKLKYIQEKEPIRGYITKVYEKEFLKTYKYPDNMISNLKKKVSELEDIVSSYMLLKHINFDIYSTDDKDKADITIKSNYIYAAFDDSNVKAFSGLEYNNVVDKRVTDKVEFFPLDASGDNLNFLSKYKLDIMGGAEELTLSEMDHKGGKKYIIISETAANSQVLDIKPGDTVDISFTESVRNSYDETLRGDDLLDEMIKNDEFGRAETYTVYAVIKDMPTSEKIPIYLLETDYHEITGVDPIPNMFSVYVPVSVTTSEIESLHHSLVAWGGGFATVEWNNAIAESRQTVDMKNLPIIQTIGLFALILSPLFWFFSQIMFYGKREEEFRMLRGLGATESEIKKIFKQDGRIFAALGVLSTAILSVLGVFVIHKLNMTYTAFFDTGALTLYRFEMPWIPLAIAVVVSAFCGYVSSIIPYRIDRKKAKKALAKEFGE